MHYNSKNKITSKTIQVNEVKKNVTDPGVDPSKKVIDTPRGAVDEWLWQRFNDNTQERQIQSWGDELYKVNDHDSIRIIFLNVKGIGINKLSQRSDDIKESMLTYDVIYLGW